MLENYVRVIADLVDVGDGLPRQSDVKYHGLLVGSVQESFQRRTGIRTSCTSTSKPITRDRFRLRWFTGRTQQRLRRVLGPTGRAERHRLRAGHPHRDRIPEDTALPTVLFQTTVGELRDILAATGRGREDKTVGVLAAVNAATQNRRTELLTAGAQLNAVIDQLDGIVSTDPDGTTVSALIDATAVSSRPHPSSSTPCIKPSVPCRRW